MLKIEKKKSIVSGQELRFLPTNKIGVLSYDLNALIMIYVIEMHSK